VEIIAKPNSNRTTRLSPGEAQVSIRPELVAERERAVLLGTRERRSAIELSLLLNITERQVVRIRRKLREEGLL